MYQNRPRDFLLGVRLGYKVKQAFAAQKIQFPRLGIVDMTLILHFKVHMLYLTLELVTLTFSKGIRMVKVYGSH